MTFLRSRNPYSPRKKFRRSRSEVPCKTGALKNFAKFTGKHLCQRLFFNEVAGLRPANLLKKRLGTGVFPFNFVKIFRTPIFIEHFYRLLKLLYANICI